MGGIVAAARSPWNPEVQRLRGSFELRRISCRRLASSSKWSIAPSRYMKRVLYRRYLRDIIGRVAPHAITKKWMKPPTSPGNPGFPLTGYIRQL